MRNLLLVTLISLAWPSSARAGEVVRDYSWAWESYERCRDRLLDTSMARAPGSLMVTISMWSDRCGDRRLTVALASDGEIFGETASVGEEPILEQLVDLHSGAMDEDWEETCDRIAVHRAGLSAEATRKLKDLGHELATMNLPLLSATGVGVDGGLFALTIESTQWNLSLDFADVRSAEDQWEVTAWMERMLETVGIGCARSDIAEGLKTRHRSRPR